MCTAPMSVGRLMTHRYGEGCDGSGPHHFGDERRVLPFSNGNLIVCRYCHSREMEWRAVRNATLAKDCRYDLPRWTDLVIYSPTGAMPDAPKEA